MGNLYQASAIKLSIRPILTQYWQRASYAGFADSVYYLPDEAEFESIFDAVSLPPIADNNEIYDCDDYAFELKAYLSRYARVTNSIDAPICGGIAWGIFQWENGMVNHACNWLLSSRGNFYWVEPQFLINGYDENAFSTVERCALNGLELLLV